MDVKNINLDGTVINKLDGKTVQCMPKCLSELHINAYASDDTRKVNIVCNEEDGVVGEILIMDWGTHLPNVLRSSIVRTYTSLNSIDMQFTCSFIVLNDKYEETIRSMAKWTMANYNTDENDNRMLHMNVGITTDTLSLRRQKVTDYGELKGPKMIQYTVPTVFPMLSYHDMYYYVSLTIDDKTEWYDLTYDFIGVDGDIDVMKEKVNIKLMWGVTTNADEARLYDTLKD